MRKTANAFQGLAVFFFLRPPAAPPSQVLRDIPPLHTPGAVRLHDRPGEVNDRPGQQYNPDEELHRHHLPTDGGRRPRRRAAVRPTWYHGAASPARGRPRRVAGASKHGHLPAVCMKSPCKRIDISLLYIRYITNGSPMYREERPRSAGKKGKPDTHRPPMRIARLYPVCEPMGDLGSVGTRPLQ